MNKVQGPKNIKRDSITTGIGYSRDISIGTYSHITPTFCITYTIMNKNYSGEPVNIHIQSLINIIHEKNWVITTKKGKGKSPLFCGNVERVIPIYAAAYPSELELHHPTMSTLWGH